MKTSGRHLAEQVEPEGLRIVRAEGSYVWDDKRRRYIDFVMGWCVGNLGWALPEIHDAIERARHPDYVYPHYDYRGWHELADLLAGMAPAGLTRCFRATGGSEAVEIAMQVAMLATGRGKFVAIEGSYHGNTIATLSLADSANRERFPRLLPGCARVEPPLDARKLGRVETLLKQRDVAAFIMEPIAINLGVLAPDIEFMTGLQQLCRRYGTLLVVDEVASGFGRTGNLFAAQHFDDVRPDIMTLGKALSGGYGGIGATLVTEKVHRAVKGKMSAYSTYGWHPLAVTAAVANLRYWKRHEPWLLQNAVEIGAFLERRMREMFGDRAEVRARGLALSVRLGEKEAAALVRRARRNRLLLAADGEFLQLLPAVNVEREVAERAAEILAASARRASRRGRTKASD